jgi:hypothetical protein
MPDFSNAPAQRDFDVIPKGTVVVVQMNIRPGNAGEDGLLKRTKAGDAEGLDCEFVVTEGEHAKRKFWTYMLQSGTTDEQEGMARSWTGTLKAIIECVKGIKPEDVSEKAKKDRDVPYSFFDGARFMCKVNVEPTSVDPKTGKTYPAKNTLGMIITPDKQEWHAIEQKPKSAEAKNSGTDNAPIPITKPAWAS